MARASVAAFDPLPWHWAGDAAASAAASGWKSMMIGLWSAGLWLLKLAFQVVDALTAPDLSASGPLGAVLPTTLWIGVFLAALMAFVQIAAASARLDGRALGRVAIGIAQFGGVWTSYLGIAAALVLASGGLTKGILEAGLNVDTLSAVDVTKTWPRELTDDALVTVLGVLSLLLIVSAFMYLLIMLVRMAALIILAATAPISAGGLMSDIGKSWFWKTTRWFFSCLLISPVAALVLVIGVKVSQGVVAGMGNSTTTAVGTAVVGVMIILIGAFSPLVVFRLLAFVEPGTASGAALRQSWSDAGGMSGVMGGSSSGATSNAATQSGGDGQSQGEDAATAQTAGRFASMLGPVGQSLGSGIGMAASAAHRGVDIATDVLGQAGIGAPGYSMTPTDERSSRSGNRGGDPSQSGGTQPPHSPAEDAPPATPTAPGGGTPGGLPGGPGAAGGAGAGAGGGAAGGAEAAAAVVAL